MRIGSKKTKSAFAAGEVIANAFLGVIVIDYIQKTTITVAYHASLLDRLKQKLQKNPTVAEKEDPWLHQDNALPPISKVAMAKIYELRF